MQESRENELKAINTFIESYIENNNTTLDEFFEKITEIRKEKQAMIPTSILREKKLGIIESAVKYLKENLNLRYIEIAKKLDRDQRTIWVTYHKAKKKYAKPLRLKEPNIWIPVKYFESVSPLQSIVTYFKDEKKMSYNAISKLLDRDNRVIWAVYNRNKKKGGKK